RSAAADGVATHAAVRARVSAAGFAPVRIGSCRSAVRRRARRARGAAGGAIARHSTRGVLRVGRLPFVAGASDPKDDHESKKNANPSPHGAEPSSGPGVWELLRNVRRRAVQAFAPERVAERRASALDLEHDISLGVDLSNEPIVRIRDEGVAAWKALHVTEVRREAAARVAHDLLALQIVFDEVG